MRSRFGVLVACLVAVVFAVSLTGCGSLDAWNTDEPLPESQEASRVIEVMEGAPTAPAAAGDDLMAVQTPPAETVGMIDPEAAEPKSEYAIVFEPYGVGPGGAGGGSLVILVSESEPAQGTNKPFDFSGRNVLVRVDAPTWDAVSTGGTYTGTIVLVPQGETLRPVLSDVEESG